MTFFTFYALYMRFSIRDEVVFTSVYCKKTCTKNHEFSKLQLEIGIFFQKKVEKIKTFHEYLTNVKKGNVTSVCIVTIIPEGS